MGRVVTDSRVLSEIARASFAKNPAGTSSYLFTYSSAAIPASDQTTTSYRSGLEIPAEEADDPAGATSQADFINRLANEHQRTKGGHDNGHEFDTETREAFYSHPYVDTNPSDIPGRGRYVGPLVPKPTTGDLDDNWPSTDASSYSDVYGTRFIKETTPSNPLVDLSVTLGELLHKGVPNLRPSRKIDTPSIIDRSPIRNSNGVIIGYRKSPVTRSKRNATSELLEVPGRYVGYQFGVSPLGSDIGKSAYALVEAKRLVEELGSQNGKTTRRRRTLPEIKYENTVSAPLDLASNGLYFRTAFSPNLPLSRTGAVSLTVTNKWSFSGAYSWYLPTGEDLWSRVTRRNAQAHRLFGIDVNPSSVYNLLPWSWLVDWVVDLGDVVQNINELSNDNMVLRYGYVMCHTVAERTYTYPSVTYRGSGASSGPISVTLRSERKQRWRATPYGFGLNPDTFSERQWSILAALGISWGSDKLR